MRRPIRTLAALAFAAFATGCGDRNSPPRETPPGREKSPKTEVLEAGAALLQGKAPLDAMNLYLDGFHFASGDMKHQMEAHHFCTNLNEDVTQCVIFDGNGPKARLIGVEYIISRNLFQTLPDDERVLWHSHDYEVKSGTLVAAGIPEAAEHELMEKLASTYGKTWHTWPSGGGDNRLPLGIPRLMMGFTADGQVEPGLVADRDRRFGISAGDRRRARADIATPSVLPGANAWQEGRVARLELGVTPGDRGKAREEAPGRGR